MEWEVSAEGTPSHVYVLLKREFDREYVPKEEVGWTTTERGVNEEGKLVRTNVERTKHVSVLDDKTSLQFRLALKSAQAAMAVLDPNQQVRVVLRGKPDGSFFTSCAPLVAS